MEEFIKRSIHAVDEEHERDTKVVAEELLGVLEQARDDHFRVAWNAEARRSHKVAPGLQGRELTIHHRAPCTPAAQLQFKDPSFQLQ